MQFSSRSFMARRIAGAVLALGASAGLVQADVEVVGVYQYEDKAFDYDGWTGADPILPIRRAKVQVTNTGGTVLGTGTTAQDGSYSITIPVTGTLEIRVQVVADSNSDTSFQRVRVRDNANNTYMSVSPSTYFVDSSMTQFDVGTLIVPKTNFGGDEANVFNMFDMAIDAWEYVVGPCGRAKVTSTVNIRWPGGSGSFASGSTATMADDDGYDDAVILHELGHVVHNLYSDSDSPGGSHSFGDSDQDPRLSLGEGFATFFGSAVMDAQIGRQALYMDLRGGVQNGGIQLRLRVEEAAPYRTDSYGAADEVAVACTLFDVVDTENSVDEAPGSDDDLLVAATTIGGLNPHAAWFQVFEGPVRLAPDLTLNDFWDGWFSEHGVGGLQFEMKELYKLRRINFFNDGSEPNDTRETAVPSAIGSWSTNRTLYAGSGPTLAPGKNDNDWYALDLVVGSRITIATRYPGGSSDADTQADTRMQLYDPDGNLVASDTNSGAGRNAQISDVTIDESGTWTFRVWTSSTMRDYGRYQFRVTYDFENQRPAVLSGPTAMPAKLAPLAPIPRTTLSVQATDAQPLTYAWTPTNGGRIVGSGDTVTFVPERGSRRLYAIELRITDSLGAETGPLTVHVDTRVRGTTTP